VQRIVEAYDVHTQREPARAEHGSSAAQDGRPVIRSA
jgi:hypothetical protein